MSFSIGIRELRQNASRYLRRVRAGETITITDRGEPIAQIRPMTGVGGVDRLIAEGRAQPPAGNLAEYMDTEPPAIAHADEPRLSDLVIAMRDEERS